MTIRPFIIEPSDLQELIKLQKKWWECQDPRARRVDILLLLHKGQKPSEIARSLGISSSRVSEAKSRYAAQGMEYVRGPVVGRKPILNRKERLKAVAEISRDKKRCKNRVEIENFLNSEGKLRYSFEGKMVSRRTLSRMIAEADREIPGGHRVIKRKK